MTESSIQARWRVAPADPAAKALAQKLALSPIMGQLLVNRGYAEEKSAAAFLRPTLDNLIDPENLSGTPEAVARITRAVSTGERILIYGDYDVDGMTATALLYHFFSLVSANVGYFLPLRLSDGYGLNSDRLREFKRDGVKLVITADCGIGAAEEAELAHELGIDLIITDHHEPEGPLPRAVAVINPKVSGSTYPFRHLAGVGVVFKLAWALAKAFSGQKKVSPEFKEFLLNAVALVALGTIADVAPLRGENRVFAASGLNALVNTRLPGLRALMNVAGIADKLSVRDVGFRLAPRLNATGRLNDPLLGFELLTTGSFGRAMEIAQALDAKNRERQSIEKEILASARAQLSRDGDPRTRRVIVLASPDWHVGVIGIVASRLAEEFYRPTVLVSLEGDMGKGSARSIPAFHIFDALKGCEGFLVNYGGHAQAAGVTIRACDVPRLRDALEAAAASLSEDDFLPSIQIDAEAELSSVNTALVRQIEMLEPFGEGNPQPLFAARGVLAGGRVRRIGADGQHLAFFARPAGGRPAGERGAIRAIAFGMGDLAPMLESHRGTISIAFSPQMDNWNGGEEVQLVVKDIRLD